MIPLRPLPNRLSSFHGMRECGRVGKLLSVDVVVLNAFKRQSLTLFFPSPPVHYFYGNV